MDELNNQINDEWLRIFSEAMSALDDNLIMNSLLSEAKEIINKQ